MFPLALVDTVSVDRAPQGKGLGGGSMALADRALTRRIRSACFAVRHVSLSSIIGVIGRHVLR